MFISWIKILVFCKATAKALKTQLVEILMFYTQAYVNFASLSYSVLLISFWRLTEILIRTHSEREALKRKKTF